MKRSRLHEIKISDLKITTAPIKILSSMPGVAGGEDQVVVGEVEEEVEVGEGLFVRPSSMVLASMARLAGLKSLVMMDPSSRSMCVKRADIFHHAEFSYMKGLLDAQTPFPVDVGIPRSARVGTKTASAGLKVATYSIISIMTTLQVPHYLLKDRGTEKSGKKERLVQK